MIKKVFTLSVYFIIIILNISYVYGNSDNLKANPYFLASFIDIGNTKPIQKDELGNWYFWFIGAVILILILLSYRKLKRSMK